MKLTKRQRQVLEWAARPGGFITMDERWIQVASGCTQRGWLRITGPTVLGNVVFYITKAGRDALSGRK